jgi:hypothetical protein
MHVVRMKDATNELDTFQPIGLAAARVLELAEKQKVDRDGETHAGRGEKKDSRGDGSDIDQRRAATG